MPASVPTPTALSDRIRRAATRQIDGSFLACFRIAFGLCFVWQFSKYLDNQWVEYFYEEPAFLFKYYGFEWVVPLEGRMRLLFEALRVVALMVACGCLYRTSSLLLAIGYTYIFLLDHAQYQNHYYLMALTTWLMVLLPAGRLWSVDSLVFRSHSATAPAWSLWLLRFQVGMPYFFGGIAKLTPDWIHGEPMRMKLSGSDWIPWVGPFLGYEWVVQVFVWGGILLDLFVVPLLLWKPTRAFAYVLAVAFHLTNAALFEIGVFPWLMILATTVYFEPDWARVLLAGRTGWVRHSPRQETSRRGVEMSSHAVSAVALTWRSRLLACGLSLYVVVQVLLPWRHNFYDNNVNWTEEGHYFSWHMKLRDKKSMCQYRWVDPTTGESGAINVLDYISPQQARFSSGDPRLVVQLAHFLKAELHRQGRDQCRIHVLNLTSLNGRKPEPLVNPEIDLGAVPIHFSLPAHVYGELTEPLHSDPPWNVPFAQWMAHLHEIRIPNRSFWLGDFTHPDKTQQGPAVPSAGLSESRSQGATSLLAELPPLPPRTF